LIVTLADFDFFAIVSMRNFVGLQGTNPALAWSGRAKATACTTTDSEATSATDEPPKFLAVLSNTNMNWSAEETQPGLITHT
jgi:hypothetical protein